jgi:hypothetical protein
MEANELKKSLFGFRVQAIGKINAINLCLRRPSASLKWLADGKNYGLAVLV